MAGDMLLWTQARAVKVGDMIVFDNDLHRVHDVERDPHRRVVTIRLEGARRDIVNVPETREYPTEVLS